MRRNAMIRIIIYSVVIFLLLTVLIVGIGLGSYMVRIHSDYSEVTTGGGSVDASQVRNLNIDWASGDITIQACDTDVITFSETGAGKYQMVYSLEGETLGIYYEEPSSYIGIHSTSYPDKQLTITVPAGWVCQELNIDSASTNAVIQDLEILDVDLDSASNTFLFENCNVQSLEVDGASNEINFNGILRDLDCDGMSCELTFSLTEAPLSIDLDGMSTALDLTLPEDSGFQVTMDGLSSQFHSEFDVSKADNTYTHGSGDLKITADGMSCSVTIRKRQ